MERALAENREQILKRSRNRIERLKTATPIFCRNCDEAVVGFDTDIPMFDPKLCLSCATAESQKRKISLKRSEMTSTQENKRLSFLIGAAFTALLFLILALLNGWLNR